MKPLVHILYELTTALLTPVILILLGVFIWMLFELGGFLREGVDRIRHASLWRQFLADLPRKTSAADVRNAFFSLPSYRGLIAVFARRGRLNQEHAGELDRLVSEIEIEAAENCSRMNLWIRIGPMLGLMGTLIPMGPALIGISVGNVGDMASNLVVAFSTTVIGLLVGGLAALMAMQRRHWYVRDLSDIEHLLRVMCPERGEP